MQKLLDFLKKIGILKVGSASYKGKNEYELTDPEFIQASEKKTDKSSW